MSDPYSSASKMANTYVSGYRAGWNDALFALLQKIPDVFSYADLKETIDRMNYDSEVRNTQRRESDEPTI